MDNVQSGAGGLPASSKGMPLILIESISVAHVFYSVSNLTLSKPSNRHFRGRLPMIRESFSDLPGDTASWWRSRDSCTNHPSPESCSFCLASCVQVAFQNLKQLQKIIQLCKLVEMAPGFRLIIICFIE